jgi:transposase
MPDERNKGAPRLMTPERSQIEWRRFDLEALLPEDHVARLLWRAVEQLDLREYYAEIRAREFATGRPALDPKLLLGLWLLANRDGVGSARQLADLCKHHHAYMWMCGGIEPNYHSLSDFRTAHGDKLDQLMVRVLASLMEEGLLTLKRVSQDGMRTRAAAGASSFRSGTRLHRMLIEAQEQVAKLRLELEQDPGASRDREKAAQKRAAEDRLKRLEKAIQRLPKVTAVHERNEHNRERRAANKGREAKPSEPRVSTTDPDARVMKMADGGFRPAYNLQFATDVDSRLVVGVDVTNAGTDSAQLLPMLEQLEKNFGRRPSDYLVDGGYATLKNIDGISKLGITVFAPVPRSKHKTDPYEPKAGDTEHVARWRRRMATDAAKLFYRRRASTSETVHGDLRQRTMQRLTVRGPKKVRAATLLALLTYNLLQAEALRRAN